LESRPVNAFILSLLSGLFVLLGTLLGVAFAPTYNYPYAYVPSYYYPFLLSSSVSGVVIVLAAVLMYTRPSLHVAWGVIVLVFSVASAIGSVTGYYALFGIVGLVLGVVGGAIGVGWRSTPWPAYSAMGAVRVCQGCGHYVALGYPYCAYCGTPAPTISPPAAPGGPPPSMPPRP